MRRPTLALLRQLLKLRYRIHIRGLNAIRTDKGSILFLPNHQAMIDPVILYVILGPVFRPRPLADAAQGSDFINRSVLQLTRAVFIPDIKRDGRSSGSVVRTAMRTVIETLRGNGNVLLYPSGRLTTSGKEEVGANAGVSLILSELPTVSTVLIRTTGLWGSQFSRADGGPTPSFVAVLLRSCLWLAANLIFFMPRREVIIELVERQLPNSAEGKLDRQTRLKMNRELEVFYNAEPCFTTPIYVPQHFLSAWLAKVKARTNFF